MQKTLIDQIEEFIRYGKVDVLLDKLYQTDEEDSAIFGHGLSSFDFDNISKLVMGIKETTPNLSQYLNELMHQKGIFQYELVTRTGFSKAYISNVINRRDNPPKYKLILIALAMELSLEETKKLLETCGYVFNYTLKDKIIVACINHEIYDIIKVEDALKRIQDANETLW